MIGNGFIINTCSVQPRRVTYDERLLVWIAFAKEVAGSSLPFTIGASRETLVASPLLSLAGDTYLSGTGDGFC
jgi:hypothetical protein